MPARRRASMQAPRERWGGLGQHWGVRMGLGYHAPPD